jgi:hypothetical protein
MYKACCEANYKLIKMHIVFLLGVHLGRFEDYSNMFLNETYLKRYITQRVKKYFDYNKLGYDK